MASPLVTLSATHQPFAPSPPCALSCPVAVMAATDPASRSSSSSPEPDPGHVKKKAGRKSPFDEKQDALITSKFAEYEELLIQHKLQYGKDARKNDTPAAIKTWVSKTVDELMKRKEFANLSKTDKSEKEWEKCLLTKFKNQRYNSIAPKHRQALIQQALRQVEQGERDSLKRMDQKEVEAWEEESDKVQFFRAEAEYERVCEELEYKHSCFGNVIRYFAAKRDLWRSCLGKSMGNGHEAYAREHTDMFEALRLDREAKLQRCGVSILLDTSNGKTLAERVRVFHEMEEKHFPCDRNANRPPFNDPTVHASGFKDTREGAEEDNQQE
ncbi:hypothetical protein AAF712_014197 [Marasmius tenuissimus]|uniref:Uncharacterized protein n=1 Tax=Marasmius tenuissimus TaxID=585030 RepID=A0ABR2ZBX6_9AGAR